MLMKKKAEKAIKNARKHYPIDETYKKPGVDIQYLRRQAYFRGYMESLCENKIK